MDRFGCSERHPRSGGLEAHLAGEGEHGRAGDRCSGPDGMREVTESAWGQVVGQRVGVEEGYGLVHENVSPANQVVVYRLISR